MAVKEQIDLAKIQNTETLYLKNEFWSYKAKGPDRIIYVQVEHTNSEVAIALAREQLAHDYGSAVKVGDEGLYMFQKLKSSSPKEFRDAHPDYQRYYTVCHRYGELKRVA